MLASHMHRTLADSGVNGRLILVYRTQQVRGSNPLCSSTKKAPRRVPFFCAGRRAHFPLTSCGRWISSPVHRVPAGLERLLSTRGSPVGSRAPRSEATSEPVPRLLPGASGAVRSANGRVDSPIHPQKPNQKSIWFGFCFSLIFKHYARLDVARLRAMPPPHRAQNAPKSPKSLLCLPVTA